MVIVLREEAEGDGGNRVVTPAAVECREEMPTLLYVCVWGGGGGGRGETTGEWNSHIQLHTYTHPPLLVSVSP